MRKNTEQSFWNRVNKNGSNGCWEWTGVKNKQGYGHFSFNGANWLAHRFSLFNTGININNKIVCHHCDNPGCVRPEHLYAGTKQSNSNDAKSRNRLWSAPGELNPSSKLTAEQVLDIRQLPFSQAVKKYQTIVTRGYICQIKYNKNSWKHL